MREPTASPNIQIWALHNQTSSPSLSPTTKNKGRRRQADRGRERAPGEAAAKWHCTAREEAPWPAQPSGAGVHGDAVQGRAAHDKR